MKKFEWNPQTRSLTLHEPHKSPCIIAYAHSSRYWAEGVANTILLHCVPMRDAARWWPQFARDVIAFRPELSRWSITFGSTEAGEIDIWLAAQRQQSTERRMM